MNPIVTKLGDICRSNRLEEKWLLAPSLRVAQQWLDSLTRGDVPAVNVRSKTIRSLALELTASELVAQNKALVSRQGGLILVSKILQQQSVKGLSYLSQLGASGGLPTALHSTIASIRLACLAENDLVPARFEVAAKGEDLKQLLQAYLEELKSHNLIDYAGLLELAIEQLKTRSPDAVQQTLLLVPHGLATNALEEKLLNVWPQSQIVELPNSDSNCPASGQQLTDLQLLQSVDADPDRKSQADGTAEIFASIGERNEVRQVLRKCLDQRIPLDDVELLYTDRSAYVPLVYENLLALAPASGPTGDDIPATFAEGISCCYSRPGKLLRLWLDWIRDDFQQTTLIAMIREGLLRIAGDAKESVSFGFLGRLLSSIGIGFGRERFLSKISERHGSLQSQIEKQKLRPLEEEEQATTKIAWLERQMNGCQVLSALCTQLFECSSAESDNPLQVLAGAKKLLTSVARSVNRLDKAASTRLVEEIEDIKKWIETSGTGIKFDVRNILDALPTDVRVFDSGPRPGCMHVSHVMSGGHSGRNHTFIVGLDDSRFPGTIMQNPLLLDAECRKLSTDLPNAAEQLKDRVIGYRQLLNRLHGYLVLSFSTQAITSDQELFPSSVVMTSFRILSGKQDGDQSDLMRWLGERSIPASFAPDSKRQCLDAAEWWMWRLCQPFDAAQAKAVVDHTFPFLARGRQALVQRASWKFTEFDGFVPNAASKLDPTENTERVVSAHQLQTIGRCPLAFFFQYGLDLRLPDDKRLDSTVWLDNLAVGSLLHELFELYMRELIEKQLQPDYDRDLDHLRELLAGKITEYQNAYPSPGQSVLRRQCQLLDEIATTFLREEDRYCRDHNSRPMYPEASLGMPSDEHSTPLDTEDAVKLLIPGDRTLRVRGRIDRIDRLEGQAVTSYSIWDYKTGGTWGYDRSDIFQQGRVLQPYLYVSMVAHRLKETVDSDAEVTFFGFFFPGTSAAGERIEWPRAQLMHGGDIVNDLCQLVGAGAFVATNNHQRDCTFCDFSGICDDVKSVAEQSQSKIDNNDVLIPLRRLRGK